MDLPATITRPTDQESQYQARHRPRRRPQPRSGQQHRPGFAGGAGRADHLIEHDAGHDHDQDDNAGPLLLVELVELATGSSTAQAKTPATITTKAATPARLRWWSFPQPSLGEQIRSRSIKHGTGQGNDRNRDQDDNAGPALLVELAIWPPDQARHRPRHQPRSRPRQQHRPGFAGETARNHHQANRSGAAASSTAPIKTPATITTRTTTPARSCWWNWWSWPQDRARHRPRQRPQPRSGRQRRPALAGETTRNHHQANRSGAAASSTAPATITARY